MSFNSIVSDIQKRKFAPVYLLHGEEPYFIDEISDLLEKHVLQAHEKAFNLSVLYGADTSGDQIRDAAMRFPMMAQYQLIIVKEAQNLEGYEKLEVYAARPVPTTVLVLCHKYKKLGKTKLIKSIEQSGVVFESKKIYDNQLPDWIIGQLKSKKLSASPTIAQLIAEHLGNDLSKIVNELDKLALQLKPGSEINDSDIQKYIGISKEFNVFEFQKALGNRDIAKSWHIGLYFISNPKDNPIIMLLAVLYNYFTKLYIYIQSSQGRSETEIAREMGIGSTFFLKDYKTAAKNYNRKKLEDIFLIIKEYDLKAKGVNADNFNNEHLLKEVIYKILH
jgi:DNA polymerase III subunit delta